VKAEPLLNRTKKLLRRYGIRARKGLGQHFLIDEESLQLIVAAAGLIPDDVVVEVGPGLGVLTAELAKRAGRVVAIELDDSLAAILKDTLSLLGNVSIINRDVLKVAPADLLGELTADSSGKTARSVGYKVVANLPYYITSPVLRHFLETPLKPGKMVVMVQKEVAEAIVAPPGRSSVLSISVQFYGLPQLVGYVPAGCFYPAPEVDSAILRIEVYAQPPVAVTDESSFFELVRAGFTAPRKQIINSLGRGLGWPKPEVLAMLAAVGIDPKRRAETLTLEEWAQLWRVFEPLKEEFC